MAGDITTGQIRQYVYRWQAGEHAAIDELLRHVMRRIRHLAIRMMRPFSQLRPLYDVDDVIQDVLIRFVRSLQVMQPATSRDFFNLAAVHMRRVLVDLARRHRRRRDSRWLTLAGEDGPHLCSPDLSEELANWSRFHEAVEQLPLEEREVVGLVYYHGWTQQQIAELFQVSVRTVRRRWQKACHRLQLQIGADFVI